MKTLYIDNTILTQDKKATYISSDASSGDSTITVQSIVGFSTDQILCIGEIGQEKTEIIKTHSSTSPSGTTVTLSTTLTFDHPQDTPVYILNWNQVEISHASTITGTKSVLTTIDIQVDQEKTIYDETSQSSGYYFTRLKDDINTRYSDYSDPIAYSGYADNTVFMIKKRALNDLNEKISDLITDEYLLESLKEARREYHKEEGKRPFRKITNYDLGNVTTGMYKIAVPDDLEHPYSNENIFSVRIGKEEPLRYYEKFLWDEDYRGIPHTTLESAYTVGDATITLTNSRDFDESGTIRIGDDTIEYSANAESTGILTVSSDGDSNHSADVDVWQDVALGLPSRYSVITDSDGSNYIVFDLPLDDDYEDQNIYIDYYKTLSNCDSDSDTLDEPEYDMFVPYLKYKIKYKKVNGKMDKLKDPDYQEWIQRRAASLKKERINQSIHFIPA